MKLLFSLPYQTRWGEELKVILQVSGLGRRSLRRILPLRTKDGKIWRGLLDVELPVGTELVYHYAVYEKGKLKREEWPLVPHVIAVGMASASLYELHDAWRDIAWLAPLYTTAYTRSLPPREPTGADLLFSRTWILRADAPQVAAGETLYLCGETEALGQWDPAMALPLQQTGLHEWSVSVDAARIEAGTAYKFCIRTADGHVLWEEGPNRTLPAAPSTGKAAVYSGLRPTFVRQPWRIAGTVLPLFSLRSQNSQGIGDFTDLKNLADWAAQTGQKLLQLLPINDTTLTGSWTDSYPYEAVSVYALHPVYADLRALPELQGRRLRKKLQARAEKLNALPQVDYEAVAALKQEWLREVYAQQGERALQSVGFKRFFVRNRHWLTPYAAFCALRDRYHTPDFSRWPSYGRYHAETIEKLALPGSEIYDEICFYYYVQYVLHVQLREAARHARNKGVVLKGDLPIGVCRYSADVWTEPDLFRLNTQAGAPPDAFAATGQNWGFPTYNWAAMAKDGYSWWKRRFEKMAEYFDAYRIDHVLGFFRIWEIPLHSVQGLLGYFSPALPLTSAEVESFGLTWREQYLRPYITAELLQKVFGEHWLDTADKYLIQQDGGYVLRDGYATQRQVQQALIGEDEATVRVREGLYTLINQVLFVRDSTDPERYHPRIAVLQDEAIKQLSEADRMAFERLYNHYFYERHNDFWARQAQTKLPPLIQSTQMMACAEDLGMIPACVPQVLDQLKILSLEVERMPKTAGQTFADPASYPWLSVCTLGTHDMSPLRLWWKEDRAAAQAFYNGPLGQQGEAPAELTPQLCQTAVSRQLESPSLLCALAWQDWAATAERLPLPDPAQERINVPAVRLHYWRYRMPVTLEALQADTAFAEQVRRLIQKAGR